MNEPTMLYRCPGPEVFEGVACETTVVDESDVEAMHAEGWHRDWMQADAAHQGAQADQLAANEQEQAEIAAKLQAAGDLKAVHKGRGVWSVVDGEGQEVHSGLTKDEAQAKAAAK